MGAPFAGPDMVSDYLLTYFAGCQSEAFVCCWLDNRHRLISADMIASGTIGHAPVYPREVVRRAIVRNAAAVILAHNHPSGDITPSVADLGLTVQLVEILTVVDVRVLDHFVVGGGKTYSFAEHGRLPATAGGGTH